MSANTDKLAADALTQQRVEETRKAAEAAEAARTAREAAEAAAADESE